MEVFWGVVVLVVLVSVWGWKRYQESTRVFVCTQCKAVDTAKYGLQGSIMIEGVLWLCFIIPGLLYSLWRSSARTRVCRTCGSAAIVPVDSPRGRELTNR